MPTSFRPLRHRDFALVFSAGAISNIGTWMQTLAVGSLAAAVTGQTAWVALAAAAAFLPMGLITPIGGALADRLDRRKVLIASNFVDAGLAGALAVLSATDHASPGVIITLTFVSGCTSALRMPFWQAMVPDLVPMEDLLAAVSLGSANWNLGRVLGPALGAVVIGLGSFTWAFALNGVTYLAYVVALAAIRPPPPVRIGTPGPIWQSIRDGARAARDEPGCRSAIGLIGLAALTVAPFIALVPAMAHLLTDGGSGKEIARVSGALTTAQGVGAVTGALMLAPLAVRFGRRRTITASLVLTPVALVFYAQAGNVPVAVALLGLVGGAYIGILSGLMTVVQLRAPAEFRGRILSLHTTMLGIVYPVGALIQGVVADRVGLRQTTIAGAALMLVVLAVMATTRPHVLRSLDDVGPEPAALPPVEPATTGVD